MKEQVLPSVQDLPPGPTLMAAGGITVERRSDPAVLLSLRRDWNRLVDQSARPNVFLTWEWLHAWWNHFGGESKLHVLVVRDPDRRVIGLGPFCVERSGRVWPLRVLRFLGSRRVGSDYLDLLAARGAERQVCEAIFHALLHDHSWDIAELSDLLDDSITFRYFLEEARRAKCAFGIATGEYCPYLPLASTLEAYFDSLGRSKRSRLKRAKKAVEGIGCTYRMADRPEQLRSALDELFELHAKRWAARGLTGNLADPAVQAFHHEVARELGPEGLMRIYTMDCRGKAIACDYVLERGNTVYFYQTGFDPDPVMEQYHPGYTLLASCLEDSVTRGAREFDFLRGREEYKARWTSEARETRTLTLVPREHGAAYARLLGDQAIRWTKRKARELLSRGQS